MQFAFGQGLANEISHPVFASGCADMLPFLERTRPADGSLNIYFSNPSCTPRSISLMPVSF